MVEQNNQNTYAKAEEKLKNTLSDSLLRNALDFIAYLKESGRTCEIPEHGHPIFYYMDEYTGLVVDLKDENNPSGMWFICCWRNNCDVSEHNNFPVDEGVKEFARNNVHQCIHCGGCGNGDGLGPARVMVFGTEYENVCCDVFHFYNPDGKNLENIKKLMELQKHIIADSK